MFGTEWSVLKLVAEHLNLTWALVMANSSDKWGKPDGRGSWRGGMLGDVVAGRADLAMNVWVQLDQSRVVDFSFPTKVGTRLTAHGSALRLKEELAKCHRHSIT